MPGHLGHLALRAIEIIQAGAERIQAGLQITGIRVQPFHLAGKLAEVGRAGVVQAAVEQAQQKQHTENCQCKGEQRADEHHPKSLPPGDIGRGAPGTGWGSLGSRRRGSGRLREHCWLDSGRRCLQRRLDNGRLRFLRKRLHRLRGFFWQRGRRLGWKRRDERRNPLVQPCVEAFDLAQIFHGGEGPGCQDAVSQGGIDARQRQQLFTAGGIQV